MTKLKLILVNITAVTAALAVSPRAFAASCKDQPTYFDWGCSDAADNGITAIVAAIFWIVSGLVAAGCLGAIVYGAIRYSSANSNASAAKEGLDIIRNAVVALVLYGCFFAIVSLLVGSNVNIVE